MSLSQRSISSAGWNMASSLFVVAILFVRSVTLARLLPVEVFGVYVLAASIVDLSEVVPNFGLISAFLHRAPETADEDRAAAVHFTLKCIFLVAWAAVLIAGAMIFAEGATRVALILLTVTTGIAQLTQTPRAILTRRVIHRRLAVLQVLNASLTTGVALILAWRGATLGALLATDVVTTLLFVVVLYLWRPIWRPRLVWEPAVMRYYLSFGSRSFLADAILRALDKIDDIWTGLFLGQTALGYYSRAYTFATYPRRILAMPINLVAGGTYAELKGDRKRLSMAFFRTNAFLVRTGFLLAGIMALVAPEFIRLVLGEKWLPMLDAFRLMLVFTLLDPIRVTVADLFVAVGEPERIAQARALQLAILVVGLFLLGIPLGITGVALAVDLMLVVGIAALLWRAREHVNFSATIMFAAPSLALIAGIALAASITALPNLQRSDWATGVLKTVLFTAAYLGVLLALERRQLLEMATMFRQLIPRRIAQR